MADRDELLRRDDDIVDSTDADYRRAAGDTAINMETGANVNEPDAFDNDEGHASTGGAILAGAATGGVIGLAGGPVGAAVGAVGGAIVGAVTERVMHGGEDMDDDTTTVDTINPPMATDTTYDTDTIGSGAYATDTSGPVVDTAPGRVMEGDMTVDRQFTDTDRASDTLELREERLSAHTERTQAGEVEIGKRVVSEQRTLDVPVSHEEVVIERHPVNRAATDADFTDTANETIRVPVMEEDVTVEKRPVVTEEINVGKRTYQDSERVTGTVRREEPVLESSGDVDVSGDVQAFERYAPSYQSYWGAHAGTSGRSWTDMEPTFRFGHDSFYDARYRGRSWNDVEADLHRDYASRYGESAWQLAKESLHDSWDNLFGRDAR